jgi:hypothetical protein
MTTIRAIDLPRTWEFALVHMRFSPLGCLPEKKINTQVIV